MAYLDELLTQTEKNIIALRSMNKHSRETIGNSRFGATAEAIDSLYTAVKLLREQLGRVMAAVEGAPEGLGTARSATEGAEADSPPTLAQLQTIAGEWAVATFPHVSTGHTIRHLVREVAELAASAVAFSSPNAASQGVEMLVEDFRATFNRALLARAGRDPDPGPEAADCLLLLLSLAHRSGFDLDALAVEKLTDLHAREYAPGPTRAGEEGPPGYRRVK